MRFLSGRRRLAFSAVIVSLVLLPFTTALAATPESMIDNGTSGLSRADGQGDVPTKRVATYPRSNYVWPFASGPAYGGVGDVELRAPGTVYTVVGPVRLDQIGSQIPVELRGSNKLGQIGAQYFIVQLDPNAVKDGAWAAAKSSIEHHGGAIVQEMPISAMIARLDAGAFTEVQALGGVTAVTPYHPALKLSPEIGRTPLIDPVKAVSDVYDLQIRLFPGENPQLAAKAIAALGANVTAVYGDTILAEINRAKLAELAGIESVQMIHENLPKLPHGEETTSVMQVGRLGGRAGFGLRPYHDAGVDGSGGGIAPNQTMMVLDSGFQLDAGDLSDSRNNAGSPAPGHRKVVRHQATNAYGGAGDLAGCDDSQQGAFTHGHMVSATALGWATEGVFAAGYGDPYFAVDTDTGDKWNLDGVAPGAKLVAFDGQVTPSAVSCDDPLQDTISAGDLYSGGSSGSLGDSYTANGARIVNFSWGVPSNVYDTDATDIDQFLFDKGDSMVFTSAGNSGQDADNNEIPDLGSLGAPGTSKNGIAVGASDTANDFGGANARPHARAGFSSTGPALYSGTGPDILGRKAPLLMAPGTDNGSTGLDSEYSCLTSDNDQLNPVECDLVSGANGTSFSSPAAAGAGLLVRDWFAQGFYPDGTSANPSNAGDLVPNISGALVKSMLIASTEFMRCRNQPGFTVFGPNGEFECPRLGNLSLDYRFNNEQGYGRIQLDNALRLNSWDTPIGVIVTDGGIPGGQNSLGTMTGDINVPINEVDSAVFEVCDDTQELRVALSWLEAPGAALTNNLDLELLAPSGAVYVGNFFTTDPGSTGTALANCPVPLFNSPAPPATDPTASAWSIPFCTTPGTVTNVPDLTNPTEAIMLTPDWDDDAENDLNPADDNQIELGQWTVRVRGNGGTSPAQRYALAIVGGVCQGPSVRFDQGTYVCNATASVTVNETDDAGDPQTGLNPLVVSGRTTVEVLDSSDTVRDTESGLAFTQTGLKFEADAVVLTGATAYDPGNGVLDVRTGDRLRVTYNDPVEDDPIASASVNCSTSIGFGSFTFAQFGQDTGFAINGGCDRNARDQFDFGYPDRYMDAGEEIAFAFGFGSREAIDLVNVEAAMRCVNADDALATEDCLPGSGIGNQCANPDRLTLGACEGVNGGLGCHTVCGPVMTILNSPMTIGLLPAGENLGAVFNIQMASTITGTPEVEMVLEVTASTSGKTAEGRAVFRTQLDVDENETLYSTDFPLGGSEILDRNNNELIEDPTTNEGDFLEDYRFETRVFGDLTDGGLKNTQIKSPWHFDADDGGFTTGISAVSDDTTLESGNFLAQWGEDKNFNNLHDRRCTLQPSASCFKTVTDCTPFGWGTCATIEDRDPVDNKLNQNWGTEGGCGWQTKAPGSCTGDTTQGCYDDGDCVTAGGTCNSTAQTYGGIWHTGRIDNPILPVCMESGSLAAQCQFTESVAGSTGNRLWFELLTTPPVEKVKPNTTIEITDFSWNQTVEMPDSNMYWTWEVDTNIDQLEPVDLKADGGILNFGSGAYSPLGAEPSNNPSLTNGYTVFSPLDNSGNSVNGTVGNNREGKNNCRFENLGIVLDTFPDLGFARPADDDVNNQYCAARPSASCTAAVDCLIPPPPDPNTVDYGPCTTANGTTDEFVTASGPLRNMDLFAWNGLDMRFSTLEDIYGDTGDNFQAAIGMYNFEKRAPTSDDVLPGYGLGIDDVKFEWREFDLVDDITDCFGPSPGGPGGSCATLSLETFRFFEGNSFITVTLLESTPENSNDCDCDGVLDGGFVRDCDSDGTDDLTVLMESEVEAGYTDPGVNLSPGECLVLNLSGTNTYTGTIPVSVSYNVPDVLFIQPSGNDLPTISARYFDYNDGTGNVCNNDVQVADQGFITASTNVYIDSGDLVVTGLVPVADNGDLDLIPDTSETFTFAVDVTNNAGFAMNDVVVRVRSSSPWIDCITQPVASVGDMADQSSAQSGNFVLRVSDAADRTALGLTDLDVLAAKLDFTLSSRQIPAASSPQSQTIDLDLDITGGGTPTSYFEGFEVASGLGSFTTVNMDFNKFGPVASDGYRCQYSNPDWVNSNSYGTQSGDTCYLGSSAAAANAFYWQTAQTTANDGGRAYSGTRSLHYGLYGPAADEHTTPMSVMEGVRTNSPVALDFASEPALSIKHQVSLMDWRTVVLPGGEATDRGIVHVQLADPTIPGPTSPGNGDWVRIEPYENIYDQQGTDGYSNCMFDPIDDGHDEDSWGGEGYDDPNDPNRRLGPSSTCYPNTAFAYLGDTFQLNSCPGTLGNAAGPPLCGTVGAGTWVESKFKLAQFQGRYVRLRFLATALNNGSTATYEQAFQHNPDPGDDGWWIDDVTVTNALTSPAVISNDNSDNSGLPLCGPACGSVTAALAADPGFQLDAPGQVVELDASASTASQCSNGTLQYRFSDNLVGVRRDWTDNSIFLDAPVTSTTYTVEVRCSSDSACADSATELVTVLCPSTGTLGGFPAISATNKTTLSWATSLGYVYAEGDLAVVSTYGLNTIGTASGNTYTMGGTVAGDAFYYVFRQPGTIGGGSALCNDPGTTWSTCTGLAPGCSESQIPGRDLTLPSPP